jgi:hypothetical protein
MIQILQKLADAMVASLVADRNYLTDWLFSLQGIQTAISEESVEAPSHRCQTNSWGSEGHEGSPTTGEFLTCAFRSRSPPKSFCD